MRQHGKMSNYRWTICSLLFFATTINYLDRTVISLLKPTLEVEFHWTETDYANIVIAFQLSYAIGMLGIGRLIDLLGTKVGYMISVFLWSIAAAAHALVKGTFGFMVARSFLGLTEAGNFPAAIKTVAEWFPKKERALATGIFNSGANIGAISAPLIVPLIAEKFGWQWAFIITGAIGIIWLILWIVLYEIPSRHRSVNLEELQYIQEEQNLTLENIAEDSSSFSWFKLLAYRQTWSFICGKFLTDPVWWFYLFWLPAFLKSEYHLTGTALALPVALVYTMASIGSIYGGWLPMRLLTFGWTIIRARKTAMFVYALCAMPVITAQYIGAVNLWYAVTIIGFAAAAHQAWSANIFTTVSDRFPKKTIASVTGIGGMAGALGGIFLSRLAGPLFDHYKNLGHLETGYFILFCICGSGYLIAWTIMHLLNAGTTEIKL